MIDQNKISPEAIQVLRHLRAKGFESFLVGGCVRDLLLGKRPKDFDICTAAPPSAVKNIFSKVIETGLKFGTVTVLVNNTAVEVTTFRISAALENEDRQSFLGNGGSPEADVQLRDFTVNALLFDGDKIIDLVGGIHDLENKIIRAVGIPGDRFKEDALRMMRAVRFSCRLNFTIEDDTLRAIGSNAALIKKTVPERVRDELVKILTSPVPSAGLRLLQSTGLLQYVLPELQACFKFDQRNPYHDKDVFDHILAVVDHSPNESIIRLAALLHDIGKPRTFTVDEKGVGHFYRHNIVGQEMSRKILARLKFDNQTVEVVGKLVGEHMSKLQNPRLSTVKKLIRRTGLSNMGRLMALQKADEAGSAPPHNFKPMELLQEQVKFIIESGAPLHIEDLAISGHDLIAMGFSEGPEIGRVLKKLLQHVINNPKHNNKEKLSEIAMKIKTE
ncbi:MAG: CCA tRNA nucleotidyltransferase [Thermincola sp.]|jgi:tRNA nucleotidyltransferase (CCA-adding enzyme)|nr:CCA tRNA nucleotidyltransferase [Thermincola sp.]MDT3703821.1 CCA tRNA nucleotidyltransferase [Thermincola sp.]